MAELSELPLRARVFLRAYPWRRISPTPWAPLRRPLGECRVAIITSAGFTLPGQPPFVKSMRGGDHSYRVIPSSADVAQLRDSHRSWAFDHSGIREDPQLAFPLQTLRVLAEAREIGSIAQIHLSFMGSITAPGRLIRDTAPEGVRLLRREGVDAALLVPVWPMCTQAVGLVAAECERQGITSVAIQLLRVVAEAVRPPRGLLVPFPHGYPLGKPHDPLGQRAVVTAALAMVTEPGPGPLLRDYLRLGAADAGPGDAC